MRWTTQCLARTKSLHPPHYRAKSVPGIGDTVVGGEQYQGIFKHPSRDCFVQSSGIPNHAFYSRTVTINKKVTLENRPISELCAPLRLIFGYDAGFGCNVEWLRKIFETLNFSHSPGARNIFTVFRKLRILHVVELPNFGL